MQVHAPRSGTPCGVLPREGPGRQLRDAKAVWPRGPSVRCHPVDRGIRSWGARKGRWRGQVHSRMVMAARGPERHLFPAPDVAVYFGWSAPRTQLV